MARRFAKVSEEEIVAINEAAFFYPPDLVNTKTTIPLRIGEERWICTSTLSVSVYGYASLFTSPSGDSCTISVRLLSFLLLLLFVSSLPFFNF